MRTTVTLDDDGYEAAQAHAQATGQRPKRSTKKASRFPVFEVPADARLIPASRIQKTIDEDGIV